MASTKCLALQLLGAKEKKAEIERQIKALEIKLLDTKEVGAILAPIHNSGGDRTDKGITVGKSREHIWDQATVAIILEAMPPSDWPSFVTQQNTYKVDMRKFNDFAEAQPQNAAKWHAAHSIKLGDSKIKKINADKLEED
jgi:hypothetical protein